MELKKWEQTKESVMSINDLLVRYGINLAKASQRYSRYSSMSKVIIILLGAFSATQGVLYKIYGEGETSILLTYSIVGLVIASVAGLQSAFKFDERASSLSQLCSKVYNLMTQIETELLNCEVISDEKEKSEAAQNLLDMSTQNLNEIRLQAGQYNIGFFTRLT